MQPWIMVQRILQAIENCHMPSVERIIEQHVNCCTFVLAFSEYACKYKKRYQAPPMCKHSGVGEPGKQGYLLMEQLEVHCKLP